MVPQDHVDPRDPQEEKESSETLARLVRMVDLEDPDLQDRWVHLDLQVLPDLTLRRARRVTLDREDHQDPPEMEDLEENRGLLEKTDLPDWLVQLELQDLKGQLETMVRRENKVSRESQGSLENQALRVGEVLWGRKDHEEIPDHKAYLVRLGPQGAQALKDPQVNKEKWAHRALLVKTVSRDHVV